MTVDQPTVNQPFRLILVTGPSRSGKSEWAEYLAASSGQSVIYVATSQPNPQDGEWQVRLSLHQQRRPANWQTVEAPTDLLSVIEQASQRHCLLIDSLGTWLANLLDLDDEQWQLNCSSLIHACQVCPATLIWVAEEVGWGVVPAYPSGRLFRDRMGQLIRQIAAIADVTYLVAGGHVLNLSQLGVPIQTAIHSSHS